MNNIDLLTSHSARGYVPRKELMGLATISKSERCALSLEIEKIHSMGDFSYIESVLYFMEVYDYDFDRLPSIINKTLKSSIHTEALNSKKLKTVDTANSLLKFFS